MRLNIIFCIDTKKSFNTRLCIDFYFAKIEKVPEKIISYAIKNQSDKNNSSLAFLLFKENSIMDDDAILVYSEVNKNQSIVDDDSKYRIAAQIIEDYSPGITAIADVHGDIFYSVLNSANLEVPFSILNKERRVDLLCSILEKIGVDNGINYSFKQIDYRNPIWLFN